MKKIYKILLFVISLVGFGLSFGILSLFYPIQYITDAVGRYQVFFPWLNNVFAGLGIFMCLCFFLLLLAVLFSPNKSNDLTLVKSGGSLQFSKQTVESTVRFSFADVEGIHFSKVRAKISRQPEKTKIYVYLSLNDSSKLVELTETVQGKIESALKSSLDIAVESINIKVTELNLNNKNQKKNHGEVVEDSRVV